LRLFLVESDHDEVCFFLPSFSIIVLEIAILPVGFPRIGTNILVNTLDAPVHDVLKRIYLVMRQAGYKLG
jgi:hypothetical protein